MRRILLQTTAIQSIGVALMLLTSLLVARLGGPSAQGSFALVKSLNDLQVAICSLGLPSAIVIMLNRTGRGHHKVERLISRYGLVLFLALPMATFALLRITGDGFSGVGYYLQALLIGWGSAFFTIFAFLRALLLIHTDGPRFSLVSIVHWPLILAMALILLNRSDLIFEIAYFIAGLGSLLIIWPLVRSYQSRVASGPAADEIDWRLLRTQSANVLLQAVAYGFQPFATNAILARADPSLASAGLFNVAALVVTVSNLIVSLVAPVLLNRWSKELRWHGFASVRRNALFIAALAQLTALAIIPMLPVGLGLVFGEAFAAAASSTAILLLATLAVVATRILTPALQGLGRSDLVSASCLCRIAGIVAGAACASYAFDITLLNSLAIGWCAGEYSALCFMLFTSRRAEQSVTPAKPPEGPAV